MKLLHLSDLHIGKRLNEFSLVEDQRYILEQILKIASDEKLDGVLIAGDVYDKSVPSGEAVTIFDDFLTKLSEINLPVFIISGNHDNPERLSFGSRLMEKSQVYISNAYNGEVKKFTMTDKYGEYNIYLLPFIKPIMVREFFDEEIDSYDKAVRVAISKMDIDKSKRNIILSHQYVTGAGRSESEEITIGGLDNIDASVYLDFDYAALGHIHSPQTIEKNIRYSGTPLKYSFSEAKNTKTVTIVEIKEKGTLDIKEIPLTPLRDMVEIKGKYLEIVEKNFYADLNLDNYYHVTLTDEEDVLEALGRLRTIYPNIMKLDYDNTRTRHNETEMRIGEFHQKTPMDLVAELYKNQNGKELTEQQLEYIQALINKIWEEE